MEILTWDSNGNNIWNNIDGMLESIWGFHSHGGTPIAGWFVREIPAKMDENWGYPYFRTPPFMRFYVGFSGG